MAFDFEFDFEETEFVVGKRLAVYTTA